MNLEFLISHDVPVLKPDDTGGRALKIMEENYIFQLPVVEDDNYLALVEEDEILELDKPEALLSESDLLNFKPIISSGCHPFDALMTLQQMNLSVLPVIDIENKYIGSITKDTVINYFAENCGINPTGGIIVLEILPRNYTLYEIARICENEDVIITNASLRSTSDGKLEVTLKLNRTILDAVVASLERHKYVVKETYGTKSINDDLSYNYNLLMTYLKI